MKTISKFNLIAVLLFFVGNLSAQFYTTKDYKNILIFQEDSSITSKFSTTRGTWEFRHINDKYFIIAKEEYIQKNYNAIALYENFELKKFYSFKYNIRIDEIAHYQDEIVIPITEVDGSWNVLCKLNMKTDDISYITLPESLRNLPNEKYSLDVFSFDEATSIAYLYYNSEDASFFDAKQVISYNLKTGEFSKQTSLEYYQYFCTLNSYHYFWDKSWKLYSKRIDDPNSKPKKIAVIGGDGNFSIKISDSEIMILNNKKNKEDNVLKSDHSGYQVLKNGELIKDKENSYSAMFNSLTSKKNNKDFYFNYSESSGFSNKFTTFTPIHSFKILKPDLFLLIVLPN
jgi:frataxin-like iron-binding protein CyaY